jgi:hypothetical protein
MDRFVIEGVPPYDGEYELDLGGEFTNRELHTLKTIAGVRAGELEEAADMGDNDLVVAFAVIALQRSGRFPKVNVDAIWDAPVGKVTYIEDEEAEPESPPGQEPLAQSSGGGERPDSSGKSSQTDGDPPANVRSLTGTPPSDDSAPSDQAISAT